MRIVRSFHGSNPPHHKPAAPQATRPTTGHPQGVALLYTSYSNGSASRPTFRRIVGPPLAGGLLAWLQATSSTGIASSSRWRISLSEAPVPFLRSISISAAMLRAISSGVSAPRSRPIGE
jgi:hypothetical protein